MRHTLLISSLLFVALTAGCKKGPGKSGEAPATAKAPAASSLIAGPAAAPAGITLTKVTLAGIGALDLPGGDGWERSDGPPVEVSHEATNFTVMAQYQEDIPPDAIAEYTKAFIKANTRDAPKYKVTHQTEGSVPGGPAARVDGAFDNGTAFATRDYLVFTRKGVAALMVRGPLAEVAKVNALADAIANSYR
jgi:hypothetical protein